MTRILMSADAAAAKLIEMIHSKKIDDRTKLLAVKDLLDRANLSGTQSIEVGVTKRSFEDVTAEVVMDLFGVDEEGEPLALTAAEDIEDAEEVEDDEERYQREDEQRQRAQERAAMLRRSPRPAATNEDRAKVEAELIRRHERGEELTDDDVMSPPDKFGVRHDQSTQRRADAMSAAASRRADKTVRSTRSTSTADPYSDRYPERSGGRRTISPKRYEQRKREGGQG